MCMCVRVRVRAYALMLTQFLLVYNSYSAYVLSAQHLPDFIKAVSFTTCDVLIVVLLIINQIRATTFRSTNTFHRTTALDKIRLPARQEQYLPGFIRQRLSSPGGKRAKELDTICECYDLTYTRRTDSGSYLLSF